MKRKDLLGKRFGRLTVIGFAKFGRFGHAMWDCLCDCGNKRVVGGCHLSNGHTKSCGCYRDEQKTKHGKCDSIEYKTWGSMLSRCTNPNDPSYPNYGGRGISVCDRWRDFRLFLADMGSRETEKLTIERINNNKGYEPGNCYWASKVTQARNRRMSPKNKCGVIGVYWNKQVKKYCASIKTNRKSIYLGYFVTISEAAEARKQGELKYWGV